MFRDYINNSIDPIPYEYVSTIKRLSYEPDFSLTCLGIALLRPRMEEYNGIEGVYTSAGKEISCVRNFIDSMVPSLDKEPMFCYYRYDQPEEDNECVKEMLSEKGFEIKESIGALIKDKANTKCVAAYHKEKNCAAIFINSSDIRLYHMLISFISLLFPALFKDAPLKQPEDYDLIKSLSKTDRDAFVQKIRESVSGSALEFRRIMLSSLLKAMHESKIAKALCDVDSQRQYVDNMEVEYANAITVLKTMIATYEGMKATEQFDKPEEDLVEYLSTNPNIHNISINGNRMTFTVATLLNNYNASAWETFARKGYIFDGDYRTDRVLAVFNDKNNKKILLNNIFSESPEFAIKIAGNYTIDLNSCYLSTDKRFNYYDADPIYKSYLPNPHLKLYSCLGGYETRVTKALRDRNYIGAIEMCCASAGSVNLDETEQTFRPFLGWLLSSKEKILHRNDGVDMTPEEALIYLIDKEKNNETN